MATERQRLGNAAAEGHRSDFARPAKTSNSLNFSPVSLGQSEPQHCPHPDDEHAGRSRDPLGEPLTIREVARVLGCSEWTVRQRYLPLGLPHFRLSRTGKLLFFHNQIVRWVLEKQRQKGGYLR